jgi:uncharacterized membrane protein YhaH (DUF805 family)
LLLPLLGGTAWQYYQAGFSVDPLATLRHPLPWAAQGVLLLCLLAYLALLFWKDEEEANRYGPNPRYDEPAGPVQFRAAEVQPIVR